MRQDVLKSLYGLHSWIGVTIGLALYVVCFSGTIALFDRELEPWLNGDARGAVADPSAALGRAVARATAAAATGEEEAGVDLTILLPTPYRRMVVVEGRGAALHIDPWTGEERPAPAEGPNGLLTRLHTDLLLPPPLGRYLVGVLGVLMLVSVLSGFLLHQKPRSELFTLRLRRSQRLFWSDLHRSVGLWGLPFHAVIALTGAVLGFAGVAVMAAALTAFEGDAGAAVAALAGEPPAAAGQPAVTLPLPVLIDRAAAALPGLVPEVVVAHRFGAAGGVVEVFGNRPGALVYYPSVTVDAGTGALIRITDWSGEGLGRRVYAMVTPLHYGSYGGTALKVLYALLGTGLCFVILSGLRVWLSRPGMASERGPMQWLTVTVVHGLPLATAGLVWAHLLLVVSLGGAAPPGMPVFLGLWLAAAGWAWRAGAVPSARGMLGLTGGFLVTMPLLALPALHGAGGWMPWPGDPVLVVPMAVAFLIGAATLRVAVERGPQA